MVGLDSFAQMREIKIVDFFFPDDRQFVIGEFLPSVLRDGRAEVEIRFRHFVTEAAMWVRYRVFTLIEAAGQPAGFCMISRDITGARREREALRKSHERTTRILESITDAFYSLDHDWRFAYINARAERLLFRTRKSCWAKTYGRNFRKR